MKTLSLILALFGASTAQFSTTAQTAIVKAHNDFRSAIALGNFVVQGEYQPAATNMMKLKWMKYMATDAQNFANSCPTDQSGVDGYGESMYYAWSPKKPTSLDSYGIEATTSWQQEFEDNGLSSQKYDQTAADSGIKEASQMIWALTRSIGCGVKNCGRDPDRFDQAYKIIVVCRYYDIGNTIGQNIYESGDTCSTCNEYYSQCDEDSGLCI